jgi:dihydrofolate reductase
MIISAIVAYGKNGVIGKNNRLLWNIPSDLKRFKKLTEHHHVLMGRKTFESIGKPLPNRTNLVITKQPYKNEPNHKLYFFGSIDFALKFAKQANEKELFIIGGEQIYEQTKHLWNKIYVTLVLANFNGDAYFPTLNQNEWIIQNIKVINTCDKDEYETVFQIWEKKHTTFQYQN